MVQEQEFQNSKILIVDDQKSNILLLEQILEQAGYQCVRGLTDSLKAVPVYNEFRPDLVLLDLNMPNMDGFDVMAALRNIEQDS